LLNIANVVKDQHIKTVEAAKLLLEEQVTFRAQEVIHEAEGGSEENAASGLNELMSNRSSEVRLSVMASLP
jgi:hypothetical protein